MSTRPSEKQTHWKQTIAILPNALDSFITAANDSNNNDSLIQSNTHLKEDDKFECFVIMNQSDDNSRNYQIDIGVDLKNEEEKQDEEEEEDHDEDDDDGEEHEVPCDCSRIKCVLIKATIQKYENESVEANKKSSS